MGHPYQLISDTPTRLGDRKTNCTDLGNRDDTDRVRMKSYHDLLCLTHKWLSLVNKWSWTHVKYLYKYPTSTLRRIWFHICFMCFLKPPTDFIIGGEKRGQNSCLSSCRLWSNTPIYGIDIRIQHMVSSVGNWANITAMAPTNTRAKKNHKETLEEDSLYSLQQHLEPSTFMPPWDLTYGASLPSASTLLGGQLTPQPTTPTPTEETIWMIAA